MKKLILFSLLTFFFVQSAYAQNRNGNILLYEKLGMTVPADYTAVSQEPMWSIAWNDKKVKLSSMRMEQSVDDNGIPAYTDELITMVKSKEKNVKLLDDGILLQDGKNIGYIKFLSESGDQQQFNFIFYISMDEKLVVFNFSCPKKLRKKWDPKAEAIAASLRIRS